MAKHDWLIWSVEHGQWWAVGAHGYTPHHDEAGRYTLETAVALCRDGGFRRNILAAKTIKVPNDCLFPVEEEI